MYNVHCTLHAGIGDRVGGKIKIYFIYFNLILSKMIRIALIFQVDVTALLFYFLATVRVESCQKPKLSKPPNERVRHYVRSFCVGFSEKKGKRDAV